MLSNLTSHLTTERFTLLQLKSATLYKGAKNGSEPCMGKGGGGGGGV